MKTLAFIVSIAAVIVPLAAPQTNRGSIEGIVTLTGSLDPLPEVQIGITGTGGEAQSTMPFTVTTDSNGRFQATDIPPGQYRLQLQRNGYFGPNTQISNALTVTVNLAPQQKIRDLTYSLTQGGTISGRVLGPDGNGLAGTPLTLMQLSYNRQTGLPVWRQSKVQIAATVAQNQANRGTGFGTNQGRLGVVGGFSTDDDGRYRLFRLPPGTYYLRAELSQGSGAQTRQRLNGDAPGPAYATTYYPNTADGRKAVPVVVRSGAESSGVDIHVQPPGVTLSGRIISGITERSAAELYLLPRDPMTPADEWLSQIRSLDLAAGLFEIRGVAPGSYVLYARTYPGARGQTVPPGSGSAVVNVERVDVDGIALNWRQNVDVKGRIIFDGDWKRTDVIFGRGQLAKVTGLTQSQPVIVSSDGTFSVASVEVGRYVLSLPMRGLPPGSHISDIRQGVRSVMDDGIITIDTDSSSIEVIVRPKGGSVQGIAQDTKGMPARGALVLVPQQPRRANVQLYRRASADASGAFSIDDLTPGDYKLFGWEEPTDFDISALSNPDFISNHETRGVSVTVREDTIAGGLVLKLIPAQ